MAPILILFVFLLLSSSHSASPAPCNKDDKNNLLVIRDSWGSSSPTPSWRSETDCCRDWAGVACDPTTGRVTRLIFPEDPAIGKIPTVLGNLEYLKVLYFHNMPNLYGTIPAELAKLTRLRLLTISSTGVYGSIPSFLADLTTLEKLDLSFNRISGSIPPALGSLPRLHTVDVSGNNLTGDASFLFGRSKRAKRIDLSNNQLYFDLTKIEFPERELSLLDMSSNDIYGSIPSQITRVAKL